MLPKTGSLAVNKFLQSTGLNPNANYRTFGSWAGEKTRKLREGVFPIIKSRKEISFDIVLPFAHQLQLILKYGFCFARKTFPSKSQSAKTYQ